MADISPNLLFEHPPATSGDLVFGAFDTAPIEVVTADGLVALGGVSVRALVVLPVRVDAVVALGGVSVSAAAVYDNRVTRWRDQRALVAHQAAVNSAAAMSSAWGITARERGGTATAWSNAQHKAAEPALALQTAAPMAQRRSAAWQIATGLMQSAGAGHQSAVSHSALRATGLALGNALRIGAASPMQPGVFHHKGRASHWQPATPRSRWWGGAMGASAHLSGRQWSSMPWGTGRHPPPGASVLHPPVVPTDPCYLPSPHLLFEAPWTGDTHLVFVCERHGPGPEPGEAVVVPVRRVYVVINEARLRRVDGDIQIPTFTMSMSLDADSWAWGFSADVPRGALPNLQPSNFGDPVELEAWVNGVPYRFLAEQLSTSRTFGKESLRISGRGLTATLDAPYAPTLNFGNTGARTAQQLMGDVLTVNGVPFGWTVDWQLTDWLVPGNVWTHQGAYVGALNGIVQAAGGYLQPHESDKVVKALLRYPTAPWDWGAAADFELPADVTTQEGIVWQENPRYNRVFVSGVSAGVLGQVTRAGTDGASLAPMVTDALITHADAARQRGVRELAAGGRQAMVSLQLPVLETTGVIPPGKMVRYVDGSTTRVGITRSVQVDVRMPEIFQSIEVETYA